MDGEGFRQIRLRVKIGNLKEKKKKEGFSSNNRDIWRYNRVINR